MGVRTQEVSGAGGNGAGAAAKPDGKGRLFGVPMGDLGWFTSLLMGAATGFAAFFAATFFGIVGVMIYNSSGLSSGHGTLDYSYSYTRLGLPVGALVLLMAWGYLGTMWVRRMTGQR